MFVEEEDLEYCQEIRDVDVAIHICFREPEVAVSIGFQMWDWKLDRQRDRTMVDHVQG